jgi:hypothetical protein
VGRGGGVGGAGAKPYGRAGSVVTSRPLRERDAARDAPDSLKQSVCCHQPDCKIDIDDEINRGAAATHVHQYLSLIDGQCTFRASIFAPARTSILDRPQLIRTIISAA